MAGTIKTISKVPHYILPNFDLDIPLAIEFPSPVILSTQDFNIVEIAKVKMNILKKETSLNTNAPPERKLYDEELWASTTVHTDTPVTYVDEKGGIVKRLKEFQVSASKISMSILKSSLQEVDAINFEINARIKTQIKDDTGNFPTIVIENPTLMAISLPVFAINASDFDKPEQSYDAYLNFWNSKINPPPNTTPSPYIQTLAISGFQGPTASPAHAMLGNPESPAFCFVVTEQAKQVIQTGTTAVTAYIATLKFDFVKKPQTGTSKVYSIWLFRVIPFDSKTDNINKQVYLSIFAKERVRVGYKKDANTGQKLKTFLEYSDQRTVFGNYAILGVFGALDHLEVQLRWNGIGTTPALAIEYMAFADLGGL